MARTSVPTGNAITNKLFAKELFEETKKHVHFFNNEFIGPNGILVLKEELSKNAGDSITYQLATIPTGTGKTEGETLEGNEEAVSFFTDSLLINELFHAQRIPGNLSIEQKRVGFEWRESVMSLLAKWGAISMEIGIFNQLAGNNANSFSVAGRSYGSGDGTKGTALNAVTAPTSNRIKIAGGQSNDQSLTSSDTFTLGLVDACIEEAELSTVGAGRINPLMIDGEEKYVMFITHEQYVDLKRDSTSAIQWFDIHTSAMQGGQISGNPIFTGAVGSYDKVVFHKSSYLPLGVNSSTQATVANTRRAIFCGMGAGCIAFGNGGMGETAMSWTERDYDYGRDLGVAMGMVWGATKSVFNSEDAAVIVASSYAARHTS